MLIDPIIALKRLRKRWRTEATNSRKRANRAGAGEYRGRCDGTADTLDSVSNDLDRLITLLENERNEVTLTKIEAPRAD